ARPSALCGHAPMSPSRALSPNGRGAYVIYEGPADPWGGANMTLPRRYHGVFRSAAIGANGAPGAWSTLYNGPIGDLRATYPGHDIYQERVGDYVYAAATSMMLRRTTGPCRPRGSSAGCA